MYYLSKILYLILSFIIGGIPFGFILSKLIKNTDIRNFGSGNIGATNVYRLMGFKYAFLVFILDGFKSYLPIFIAKNLFGFDFAIYIFCVTVLGHVFSPWLGFHGGKGVSSFILGTLALDSKLFLINAISWVVVFLISNISALSALISILLTTLAAFSLYKQSMIPIIFLVLVIFWAHRKNIENILNKYKKLS